MDDAMLTTGQVAKLLGITGTTVHNYIKRGILIPDEKEPTGSKLVNKFTKETVNAMLSNYITGSYDGEKLFCTSEIAQMTGMQQRRIQLYIQNGSLKPDVVLPATKSGRSGRRLFTKRAITDCFGEQIRDL